MNARLMEMGNARIQPTHPSILVGTPTLVLLLPSLCGTCNIVTNTDKPLKPSSTHDSGILTGLSCYISPPVAISVGCSEENGKEWVSLAKRAMIGAVRTETRDVRWTQCTRATNRPSSLVGDHTCPACKYQYLAPQFESKCTRTSEGGGYIASCRPRKRRKLEHGR